MTPSSRIVAFALILSPIAHAQPQHAPRHDGETISGHRLTIEQKSHGYVENMTAVITRDAKSQSSAGDIEMNRGVWIIPSRRATYYTKSGEHNLVNKYGDTEMGVGFNRSVNIVGFYVAGQSTEAVWAEAIRVMGYRDDALVDQTEWFDQIDENPNWMSVDLQGVDRIVIEAIPSAMGVAFYGIDNVSYIVLNEDTEAARHVLLDFEDCAFHQDLSGTDYAGLDWEFGSSESSPAWIVPAPVDTPDLERLQPGADTRTIRGIDPQIAPPELLLQFEGVVRGDAGSTASPPDTHGAIGPNHFVEVVNRNFAVFARDSGVELANVRLGSFLPGSNGDPRINYDQHSGRWIIIVSDFSSRIYLAVSLSDDPMGLWYKTSILVSADSDSACWPDYPTLGVDDAGIYIASLMVGCGYSIFAVEKSPLLSVTPSLGAVTAFRGLSGGGAIQPAATFGDSGGELFVSLASSSSLRLQQLLGSITFPVLQNYAPVSVDQGIFPPDAPALGSAVPLDTVGSRIMNAVYRNGSLWLCNTVNANGRSACKWYEIDMATRTAAQQGVIDSSGLYYYFPSIAVNASGQVALGFSGSSPTEYASTYFTGRRAFDPPGMMAPPVLYRSGQAPLNVIDGAGRNRFGDYSFTSVDPRDDLTFWTIQEFAHSTNTWGTEIVMMRMGDCNDNGIEDPDDIAGGTSLDCNTNMIPDECEYDCNATGIPDNCDIANETSEDCNENSIPDECEFDCNGTTIPDDCDLANQTSEDCNSNGVPDECDLANNDCNFDEIPDDCQLAELVASLASPTDANACPLSDAQFTVSSSLRGLSFQWKKIGSTLIEGVDAVGTQTETLTILSAEPPDTGFYYCEVNLGCISTTSELAFLTVLTEFGITMQPADVSTTCLGNTVAIEVQATGDGLTYAWRRNGQLLAEQSGKYEGVGESILRIIDVDSDDLAEYTCDLSDSCGENDTSTAAEIQFADAEFDVQPIGQCATTGSTVAYTAIANVKGFSIFRQWYKNGMPMFDGGNVSGAFADTLTIQNVSSIDEGSYSQRAITLGASCIAFSDNVILVLDTCLCAMPGDMDSDGDLDLADLQIFMDCFERNVAESPECACANLDTTNDAINLDDWTSYATLITGP